MPDCIFCKIVRKEIQSNIIYEDDKILAFLDIKPVHPGHTLVMPKEHHKMMLDTPDNLISYIFIISKKLMKAIKETTNADYVVVSVVGLDIPHFHVHLVPRYKNDGLATFWPGKHYKEGEAKKVANKLHNYLKGVN